MSRNITVGARYERTGCSNIATARNFRLVAQPHVADVNKHWKTQFVRQRLLPQLVPTAPRRIAPQLNKWRKLPFLVT